jgi:hypothetical protein
MLKFLVIYGRCLVQLQLFKCFFQKPFLFDLTNDIDVLLLNHVV